MVLDTPPDFNLDTTVRSSWLRDLAPHRYEPDRRCLRLVLGGPAGVRTACVRQTGPRTLAVEGAEGPELLAAVRAALRLDEDFTPLYRLTDADPHLRWVRRRGAGRLLRSPTAFEDLVKALIYGRGGRARAPLLCERLCALLGARGDGGAAAFPDVGRLAAQPLSFYQRELGAGHIAAPLHHLVERCHAVLYPEALRRVPSPPPADDHAEFREWLRQERDFGERMEALLLSIKGFGQRAADLILPLLGCYEAYLLVPWLRPAWERRFLVGRARRGLRDKTGMDLHRAVVRRLHARIDRYGPYRGLALWLLVQSEREAKLLSLD